MNFRDAFTIYADSRCIFKNSPCLQKHVSRRSGPAQSASPCHRREYISICHIDFIEERRSRSGKLIFRRFLIIAAIILLIWNIYLHATIRKGWRDIVMPLMHAFPTSMVKIAAFLILATMSKQLISRQDDAAETLSGSLQVELN